jgi:Family of unknown function (DUF5681)
MENPSMIDAPEIQAESRDGLVNGRLANGRFAPGSSGNPAGRPKKGEALADLIRRELDAAAPDGRLKREVLAATIVDGACGGDFRFVRPLLEKLVPYPIEEERALPDWMPEGEGYMLSPWLEARRTGSATQTG